MFGIIKQLSLRGDLFPVLIENTLVHIEWPDEIFGPLKLLFAYPGYLTLVAAIITFEFLGYNTNIAFFLHYLGCGAPPLVSLQIATHIGYFVNIAIESGEDGSRKIKCGQKGKTKKYSSRIFHSLNNIMPFIFRTSLLAD